MDFRFSARLPPAPSPKKSPFSPPITGWYTSCYFPNESGKSIGQKRFSTIPESMKRQELYTLSTEFSTTPVDNTANTPRNFMFT